MTPSILISCWLLLFTGWPGRRPSVSGRPPISSLDLPLPSYTNDSSFLPQISACAQHTPGSQSQLASSQPSWLLLRRARLTGQGEQPAALLPRVDVATMRRRGVGPPLLVTFLAVVLLLASEVVTFGYGCRALKADCVMAVAAATPKHGDTVLMRAAPPGPGEAREAVYGESKRLVPQGPNPLHN